MSPSAQDFKVGQYSSFNIIGETTEAVHKLLMDRYDVTDRPPRLEEDLKFIPKDREEVIYVYMYRAAQNPNLQRQKRLQLAPVEVPRDDGGSDVFYHRPPLLMDLFYMVAVHSRFRSDAERLLGWVLLTLHHTPKLVYRPRRFLLPDGRKVDSLGRSWNGDVDPDREGLQVEKVSLALVEDLTVGDAINLFTLHEAPYRPFLTYRARVALDGPLVSTEGGSSIDMGGRKETERLETAYPHRRSRPSGRIGHPNVPTPISKPPGPKAHNLRKRHQRTPDNESEE